MSIRGGFGQLMATLLSDRTQQHNIEFARDGRVMRAVRSFFVQDLDTTDVDQVLVKVREVTGIPEYGDFLPGQTGDEIEMAKCKRVWVGDSDGKNCRVLAYYDNQMGAITALGGYLYMQRSSRLVEKLVMRLPDGTPIKVDDYSITTPIPGDGEGATVTRTIRGEVTPLSVRVPVSMIEITGTGQSLSDIVWQAMGTVNDSPWQGLPAGYWLCSAVTDRLAANGAERSFYLAFESQVHKPWLEDIFLYDKASGQTLVNGDDLPTNYEYSIRQAVNGGAATVGYYPMANFGYIFGNESSTYSISAYEPRLLPSVPN
jgi:hypothetical protein